MLLYLFCCWVDLRGFNGEGAGCAWGWPGGKKALGLCWGNMRERKMMDVKQPRGQVEWAWEVTAGRKDRQTDSNQEYSHSNRVLLVCETQVGEISDLEAFCPSMLPVSLLLATCLLILLFIIRVWEVGIPVPSGNLRVSLAVVCSQFFGCSWY